GHLLLHRPLVLLVLELLVVVRVALALGRRLAVAVAAQLPLVAVAGLLVLLGGVGGGLRLEVADLALADHDLVREARRLLHRDLPAGLRRDLARAGLQLRHLLLGDLARQAPVARLDRLGDRAGADAEVARHHQGDDRECDHHLEQGEAALAARAFDSIGSDAHQNAPSPVSSSGCSWPSKSGTISHWPVRPWICTDQSIFGSDSSRNMTT